MESHRTTATAVHQPIGIARQPRRPAAGMLAALFTVGWMLLPSTAQAQAADAATPTQAVSSDVEQLRQELERLRREYDARIADLENRLAAVTAGAGTAPAAPAPTPPPPSPEPTAPAQAPEAPAVTTPPPSPEPTAPAPAPQAPLPPTETGSQPVSSSKVFNPDIAVIGNVLGAAGTNHIEDSPGWQLNEAEASFQAVVDPYARGDFFIAVGPDGAEVEEGFITFTSLPGGLLVKAGKMRGQFGKVNTMHTHALPWTDRPLVTRNLLGGDEGISDGGITVSTSSRAASALTSPTSAACAATAI